MSVDVAPFLMFAGRAEEAMNFYLAQFSDSRIENIVRYGEHEVGLKGSVKMAKFRIGSLRILCTDSVLEPAFAFTPAVSLYARCQSESDLRRLAQGLGKHGSIVMPVDNYGFSQLFAWVRDRFGVSWQLNWT